MNCPSKLEVLGCNQTGVGFLAAPVAANATSFTLQDGQGDNFPTPTDGRVFYVDIGSCGCCARVKVTGRAGNVFTIEPSATCACMKSNARVSYASTSPEHMRLVAQEVPFNITPPLVWDCVTRTLSIDCEALKDMVATPCA